MRELIILAVLWLLMLRRHGGTGCSLSALAFLLGGLLFLRAGGRTYLEPVVWMQLMGIAGVLAGFVTLLLWARDNARTAERAVRRDASSAT